jgi:thiol-disulfide isomerase/thioredoxin
MKSILTLLFSLLLASSGLFAAGGHNIRVKLDNYPEKKLVLGFYYGEKPYVKDTVERDAEGYFTFKADTLLPAGVYLLVMSPSNNFIQFLLPEKDQDFILNTDANLSVEKMKVSGSDDNKHFYDFMQYLGSLRPQADTLRAQLSRAKGNAADSVRIAGKLDEMDKAVRKYQLDFVTKYAGSAASKIVKSSIEPEAPDFKDIKDEQDRIMALRHWWHQHYFDNIDIADPFMLRSPILHPKVDQYIQKFTFTHPDSINRGMDMLLGKLKKSPDNFKYYLVHFLNFYAKSNLVGMDACYVHLALNYYCKGEAAWTKKEELEKICDNAQRLEPTLIGKIAPNITVKTKDNKPVALWDVDADYTVLFFWDPECGHCKKSAPFMVEFAKNFKDRGVKVLNVCTATGDKANDCWKGAEEKEFSDLLFVNTWDPYIQSRYKTLYNIQTTPQILILDRKHEILMKRIAAEELGKIMEQVMKIQEDKKKEAGGK